METDYLVIGAGATGLAFADELFTRTDAHITLVDRRPACGGHWNDAYPFVKLHQPSVFYGVESRELAEARIDESGPNAGFLSLADGSTVLEYFHAVMRERLLPSGRVRFLPMSEVTADGAVRNLLSRREAPIRVRRKTVNAAYYTNSVPRTHVPKFAIDDDVCVVPPNDAPMKLAAFRNYCVLGAGKTALDTLVWLLEMGAEPKSISWVAPRDGWFLNRAYTQPSLAHFEATFGNFADQREAMAQATDFADLAHRLEACGAWLRLDPAVEPAMYHGPTVSEGEVARLRTIERVIRGGRVTALKRGHMTLTHGEVATSPDTLFIDCTASALPPRRHETPPVFDADRITLQMLRFPQIPFSAALCAFLEASFDSDEEKNACARPMTLIDTVEDFVRCQIIDMTNRFFAAQDPRVRAWITESRLDGYSRIARSIPKEDAAKQAILQRIRDASMQAFENLPRLVQPVAA